TQSARAGGRKAEGVTRWFVATSHQGGALPHAFQYSSGISVCGLWVSGGAVDRMNNDVSAPGDKGAVVPNGTLFISRIYRALKRRAIFISSWGRRFLQLGRIPFDGVIGHSRRADTYKC